MNTAIVLLLCHHMSENLLLLFVGRSTFRSVHWTRRQTKYWIYRVVSLKIMHDSTTSFAVFQGTEINGDLGSISSSSVIDQGHQPATRRYLRPVSTCMYVLINQHSASNLK